MGNNPVNSVDPLGTDAIVLTTSATSVFGNGHTSAIIEKSPGDWYYFYWSNVAAVLQEVKPNKESRYPMASLTSFNAWLTGEKATKDTSKEPKYENSIISTTDEYRHSTYIEGDFSSSLTNYESWISEVDKAHVAGEKFKNKYYDLFNGNCMQATDAGLDYGTLPDGETTFGDFSDFKFIPTYAPNHYKIMIRETFGNTAFNKETARVQVKANANKAKRKLIKDQYDYNLIKYAKMLGVA